MVRKVIKARHLNQTFWYGGFPHQIQPPVASDRPVKHTVHDFSHQKIRPKGLRFGVVSRNYRMGKSKCKIFEKKQLIFPIDLSENLHLALPTR